MEGKFGQFPTFQPANGASNVDCLPNHPVDSCQEEGPNTHPPRRRRSFSGSETVAQAPVAEELHSDQPRSTTFDCSSELPLEVEEVKL